MNNNTYGTYSLTLEEDFDAFDRLDADVRTALANAPVDYAAPPMLEGWAFFSQGCRDRHAALNALNSWLWDGFGKPMYQP